MVYWPGSSVRESRAFVLSPPELAGRLVGECGREALPVSSDGGVHQVCRGERGVKHAYARGSGRTAICR